MNIVPATPEHAEAIARVHVRSWQAAYADILDSVFLDGLSVDDRAQRWADILQKAESRTLVAQQDGNIVGFVSYGPYRADGASPAQGEIWALYADPASWGQGIGRALLLGAVDELCGLGRGEVSLWVFSLNDRAINFYLNCGFAAVEGSEQTFELGGRQIEEVCLRLRDDADLLRPCQSER